jgi:hypothetical protein
LQRLTDINVFRFEAAADPVDVSAIAALPKIVYVSLTPEVAFSGVEDFARTATLADFGAGYAAFEVLSALRDDLPFRAMTGEMTPEQHDAWSRYVRRNR